MVRLRGARKVVTDRMTNIGLREGYSRTAAWICDVKNRAKRRRGVPCPRTPLDIIGVGAFAMLTAFRAHTVLPVVRLGARESSTERDERTFGGGGKVLPRRALILLKNRITNAARGRPCRRTQMSAYPSKSERVSQIGWTRLSLTTVFVDV